MYRYLASIFLIVFLIPSACSEGIRQETPSGDQELPLVTGAEQTHLYFPLIEGRRVAFAGNHTSMLAGNHLVDSLLNAGMNLVKVFSPEHGFRGRAADGELVSSGTDSQTGLPVISLYGSNRRPTPDQLSDVDVILFDIQDVGVRFYTYISTMSYIMEAAARENIPVIILDRPNPHGHYVDGPVLEAGYASFVGLHPVPVVHGMTIGEYAGMVNGEAWLGTNMSCDLTVIPVKNYTHARRYHLPVPPSPNLPDMRSVYLYPSLCFLEGTVISLGRGTSRPFQVFGHSSFSKDEFPFKFVPQSLAASPNPPELGKTCHGRDLGAIPIERLEERNQIHLDYLLEAYRSFPDKSGFFNPYFEKLAGNGLLRMQVLAGLSAEQITESWQEGLEEFRKIRRKYLLYPDFE
ncbi:MAG: DUF1343 domain-containing protein [Bacteroidales bacterium]